MEDKQFEYITKSEFQNVLNEAVLLYQETYSAYYQDSEAGRLLYLSIKKLLNHCNCISILLDGTSFEAVENSNQVDHASAKVLLRSALEIYITLASLFWFEGKEKLGEQEFRFLVYKYSGLKSRQKLDHENITNYRLREKISNEKSEIKKLEKMIEYKGLELGKEQVHIKNIIKKGWQAKSIISRLEETTLPNHFKKQYSYLCGYSHSGFDSYMQLAIDESSELNKKTSKEIIYFLMSFLLGKLNQALVFNLSENLEIKTDLTETYKLLKRYYASHSDEL